MDKIKQAEIEEVVEQITYLKREYQTIADALMQSAKTGEALVYFIGTESKNTPFLWQDQSFAKTIAADIMLRIRNRLENLDLKKWKLEKELKESK